MHSWPFPSVPNVPAAFEARLPPASADDGTALGLQCVGVARGAPGKVQAFGRLDALMDVRDNEGIRWGSGGFWQRLNWLKFGAKEIKGGQVYQVLKNGVAGWWFGTFGLFFHIGNVIIPTDFHSIFFRGLVGCCKRGGCHVSMALGNSRLKPGKLSGSQESNITWPCR